MGNINPEIFKHIDCPICKNSKFNIIIKFTPNQFLNEERREYYDLQVLGIDFNTNFFIKKCKKCGFVFLNPKLREDLYSVVYNKAKVGQYKIKNWMYDKGDIGKLFQTYDKYREIFPFLSVLMYFKNHFKKPKNDGYKQLRLLDYGCGNGHILDLCKVFGIDGVGVDLDLHRLSFCKQKGLNVMLPPELFDTEKFNIAISTSVVEHVDDLDAYFNYISSRLLRNGVFYFNGLTPKIIKIERKNNCFKNVMPLEHINYFTRRTLMKLVRRHGFCEVRGKYGVFAMDNLVHLSYPLLKRYVFRGFYPTGNFEVILKKI